MRCPVLVMVPDLERMEGFAELVRRLPEGQRGKRMGQRFPLVADLGDERVPRQGRELGGLDRQQPLRVDGLLDVRGGVEPRRRRGRRGARRATSNFFRFLGRIRERRERLARLVRRVHPEPARGTA